jgi:putative peptidoglycan lipid II flippase
MLVKVLAPGFYARQDTRTPVRIGIYAMLANMGLNLLFVVPMAMAGIEGPHAGLALATALAAFINAGLLFRMLKRSGVFIAQPGWGGFASRLFFANLAMALPLWWLRGQLEQWLAWAWFERATHLGGLILLGIVVYFAALWLVGVRPKMLLGRPDKA